MTNEKAIEVIKEECYIASPRDIDRCIQINTALDTAIKALEQTEPKKCSNCISRDAVLDLVADYDLSMGQVVRGIHDLPSIEPERKSGKWLPHMVTAKCESIDRDVCSECRVCFYGEPTWSWKYCPKCGAPMEVNG